ncbi:MAG: polymer-forming cytoskeletal protein [Burkholderiaceae bacterium]
MALQPPFFGKRDADTTGLRRPTTMAQPNVHGAQNAAVQSPVQSPTPMTPAAAPAATAASASAALQTPVAEPTGGSKLTVGPNIKLKGVEITDCDTLFVEGTVEATMDSRLMQIAEGGAFQGSACIDLAEIHGSFDGDLTVRDKLTVYATGKVTGKIRYGKLVIEEGGQLSGEVRFGTEDSGKAAVRERTAHVHAA